jgi:glyoxylase-like metal-dependent hydrolase (beta-lactamase superfamily II)
MSDISLAAADAPSGPVERRGLAYPFGKWVPESGTLHPVAEGVYWLRMPIPFGLDHINLWVLDDGDAWVLVDTGVALPGCKALWRSLLEGPLSTKPVGRILVTHYHPDHLGLAGWLGHKTGAPLLIARTEYLMARMLCLDIADAPPPAAVEFYASSGWPEPALDGMRKQSWGFFSKLISPLPTGFQRIEQGDTLAIGGRRWTVVTGRGHAPEHSCLLSDDGLFIAGDQVLPRITSNVSVYPTEPLANPLADWLGSIAALRAVPDDVLVLPSHNEPFKGLHVRLDQLADHHEAKLAKLADYCAEPRSAFEAFPCLFGRTIGEGEYNMATGEALAHLHWLEAEGQVVRLRQGGVDRFVRA